MLLIQEAKQLYRLDDELEVYLKVNVFAIAATTIDLCLPVFCWATFRSTRGGIKLHSQLDLKTVIPEFILFSPASVHDVNMLDVINFDGNGLYNGHRIARLQKAFTRFIPPEHSMLPGLRKI
jgi:hypothetical protein